MHANCKENDIAIIIKCASIKTSLTTVGRIFFLTQLYTCIYIIQDISAVIAE